MSYTSSDAETSRRSGFVQARLNYLADTEIRPEIWNENFARNVIPLEPVDVRIIDGGRLSHPPRLDVEGIALVSSKADLVDLLETDDAARQYRQSLVAVMLDLTGADEVSVQPTSVIRRAKTRGKGSIESSSPASFVHSDLSRRGVEQTMGAGFAPPKGPVRRHTSYNMWRLLSNGPTDLPLAVCDARSVSQQDIVYGDSKFETMDFMFETILLRPNRDHRWIYFPDMTSDHLLVFKQFDTKPGEAVFVPHCAFTDPSCPPGAAPRVSIECRCMAYWY